MELDDLLPAATIMVVTVTATTTAGTPLPPEDLQSIQEACGLVLRLDEARKKVLFVLLLLLLLMLY